MKNFFIGIFEKLKKIYIDTVEKVKRFFVKNGKKIVCTVFVVCVFLFCVLCGMRTDASTANAQGLDIPVSGDGISIVYSEISTPVFSGKMYSSGTVYTNMQFYGSFSLLFEVDLNDKILDIYINDGHLFDNTNVYSNSVPMKYWNSFDKVEEIYGCAVDLVDYNFPSSTTLEGGALSMLVNSDFSMTYTVNNGRSAIITYEWLNSEDLYYIDIQFSFDGAFEFVNIYDQKFDYYIYDGSSNYGSVYNSGFAMGYAEGTFNGYQEGYQEGLNVGYDNAVNDGDGGVLKAIGEMVTNLANTEIFPGVPLSYIFLIAFGILALKIILNLFAT